MRNIKDAILVIEKSA